MPLAYNLKHSKNIQLFSSGVKAHVLTFNLYVS